MRALAAYQAAGAGCHHGRSPLLMVALLSGGNHRLDGMRREPYRVSLFVAIVTIYYSIYTSKRKAEKLCADAGCYHRPVLWCNGPILRLHRWQYHIGIGLPRQGKTDSLKASEVKPPPLNCNRPYPSLQFIAWSIT